MTFSEDMITRAFDVADGERKDEAGEYDDEYGYSMLRALIVDCFNPPDKDVAEYSILAEAVAGAYTYIDSQPCTCLAPVPDPDDEYPPDVVPCDRCYTLGRLFNTSLER